MSSTNDSVTLDDKWTIDKGRILISGAQALARVLLAQRALDEAAGLKTAGYISGYRGSPLGNVDSTLWSIGKRLAAADIRFAPGVNEELAATAVRGTQQLDMVPDPLVEGVFAAWYGKGPGVDRSSDALKHGNILGAHPKGGVLVMYGDDHGGKSSTVSHQSEQALSAALIPSLYPADVGEIIEYGLLGYALSRYSGSWVGLKLVNEVAEQTASVDLNLAAFAPRLPPPIDPPPEGVHARSGPFSPLRDEQIVSEYRLPRVQAFVRANRIDRTAFQADRPRLGLVTAGKSYADTRQALALLGLDDSAAAALGLSLYKVGCIWPLETEGLAAFAAGHDTLFVIEEKRSFVELQAAAGLVNRSARPQVIGKFDADGRPLLPQAAQLDPAAIALAIVDQLSRLGVDDERLAGARARLAAPAQAQPAAAGALVPRRSPYFCSGCPHSRSTRIPDGSLSLTGIGCHTMVGFVRPEQALLPTHMGGEGGNWIGLAPFTGTKHIFQNMGDGTYYHSGLLAIRAAVASGANITYKILYNDAVAMTGGQPVDGPISVAEIAHQVLHEGVRQVVLVSDNPAAHRDNSHLPQGLRIAHRDQLEEVQRELREAPGCTVLIYEQTCAAEKRRRRKRGTYPDPQKRLFISTAVCEGCGDCSVQSTCVSLTPVETAFGTKRAIDQSSCNKDYSCLNGFCPSFITVEGAELRKSRGARPPPELFDDLPAPALAPLAHGSYNLMVAGIGGTGVITVSAILAMAAHLQGLAASSFDMTGLAQKNGAVFSHLRIAASPAELHAQKLGRGEADLLLGFDLVATLAPDALSTAAKARTRAIVNTDVAPTVAFQFDRDAKIDAGLLMARLRRAVDDGAVEALDAAGIATALLGDSIGVNMFLVGAAAQRGLLPVGLAAIEQAIRLNGVAVEFNLTALHLGRVFAVRPERLLQLTSGERPAKEMTLDELIAHRAAHLAAYQDARYAARYRALVERVRAAEQTTVGSEALTHVAARVYARLLAYKDEYEVARLLTSAELQAEIAATFEAGGTLSFNLAPPLLGGKPVGGRPPKRAFKTRVWRPWLRALASLKRLRGTPLDPFGLTAERRAERALLAEYERLVEQVLGDLTADNHAAAIALLGLAEEVRGFGPVKQAALERYRTALPEARAQFAAAAVRAA